MNLHDNNLLADLNNSIQYDISNIVNNYLHQDDENNIFSSINLSSDYQDVHSIVHKYSPRNNPLIISCNIQSLQSKFDKLKSLINEFRTMNLEIDIIALQETWNIPYTNMFTIPGFHPIVTITRGNSHGGGVGFYINSNHKYKLVNISPSISRIFENLTIELTHYKRKILLSCVYRSPNPPPGTSISSHLEQFITKFDSHLLNLSNHRLPSYIMLDSNINLNCSLPLRKAHEIKRM